MTTQKTYSTKSNATRAGKVANGGTLDGLQLLGSEGAWYYGKPDDAAPAPQQALDVTEAASDVARALVQAGNAIALAGLQAEQGAQVPAPRKTKAKVPAKKPVANHALVTAPNAAPKTPAKRAPAKAAKPKAAPTGKDIASAYKTGVKGIPANATKGQPRTVTGYKLQHERIEANGVQRMSKGTVGDQLWSLFDKALAALQKGNKDFGAKDLLLGAVRKVGTDAGFNNTTVALAFYQWRRFMGVRGRGKKQKVD